MTLSDPRSTTQTWLRAPRCVRSLALISISDNVIWWTLRELLPWGKGIKMLAEQILKYKMLHNVSLNYPQFDLPWIYDTRGHGITTCDVCSPDTATWHNNVTSVHCVRLGLITFLRNFRWSVLKTRRIETSSYVSKLSCKNTRLGRSHRKNDKLTLYHIAITDVITFTLSYTV